MSVNPAGHDEVASADVLVVASPTGTEADRLPVCPRRAHAGVFALGEEEEGSSRAVVEDVLSIQGGGVMARGARDHGRDASPCARARHSGGMAARRARRAGVGALPGRDDGGADVVRFVGPGGERWRAAAWMAIRWTYGYGSVRRRSSRGKTRTKPERTWRALWARGRRVSTKSQATSWEPKQRDPGGGDGEVVVGAAGAEDAGEAADGEGRGEEEPRERRRTQEQAPEPATLVARRAAHQGHAAAVGAARDAPEVHVQDVLVEVLQRTRAGAAMASQDGGGLDLQVESVFSVFPY
jgi:hypothetical protein